MFKGELVSIHVAPKAGVPLEARLQIAAIAGRGLEGDRYFDGTGYWSNNAGVVREVTLIEIEAIEALAREKKIELAPGAARRNLVTRGVPLNHLGGAGVSSGRCATARNTAMRTLSIPRRPDRARRARGTDSSRWPTSENHSERRNSGRRCDSDRGLNLDRAEHAGLMTRVGYRRTRTIPPHRCGKLKSVKNLREYPKLLC